ncbi:unnamed protein product [Thelazia callipaeda]|uniref:ARF7 effector protein C-terminal domain-containing protein n=1 Tax=Thelazia callipaeda TaxID=103827 RepID=A0A0N5D2R2_THECL|nr:unnamed protein product [Thelazia callipaeda]
MSSVSLRLSADESAREDNNIALNQSMPDAYSDVKKVAMVRSSSELLPTRLEQSSWPNRLSCYRLGTTMNEVPLIGECRSCAQSYHCNCCPGCDHLVIIYAVGCQKFLTEREIRQVTAEKKKQLFFFNISL